MPTLCKGVQFDDLQGLISVAKSMKKQPHTNGLGDACTNPAEYKTDKRCYVTDAQKKEKPYNATVYLTDSGCTGTIRKFKNSLYLYTAAHCVDDKKTGLAANTVTIKTQTGQLITATKNRIGNYDAVNDSNYTGDLAIYSIPAQYNNIPSTDFSETAWNSAARGTYDARVVGYGALKIMSDAEIETFKNRYIRFLKSNGQNTNVGMRKGGVDTRSTYGQKFLTFLSDNDRSYYSDLFQNTKTLKVSKCKYVSSTGAMIGCQTWGGNSGGGIFDNNGKLMGILTRGYNTIGGKGHAGREDLDGYNDFYRRIQSVPLRSK